MQSREKQNILIQLFIANRGPQDPNDKFQLYRKCTFAATTQIEP